MPGREAVQQGPTQLSRHVCATVQTILLWQCQNRIFTRWGVVRSRWICIVEAYFILIRFVRIPVRCIAFDMSCWFVAESYANSIPSLRFWSGLKTFIVRANRDMFFLGNRMPSWRSGYLLVCSGPGIQQGRFWMSLLFWTQKIQPNAD